MSGTRHTSTPFLNFVNTTWFPKKLKPDYFKNDSFFKLQHFIINNFYSSYEHLEIDFKKGITVRNTRLTMQWWPI